MQEGHFTAEAGIFESVLQAGVRGGELDCSDPKSASRALVQATNSLLPFSLSVSELGRHKEFEKAYGYFRPIIKDVVEKYLDCGNPRCGFALIRKAHLGQTKRRPDPLSALPGPVLFSLSSPLF